MGRWYTSDHHFGHENVIRYCDRPFSDAYTMDKAMVARWFLGVRVSEDRCRSFICRCNSFSSGLEVKLAGWLPLCSGDRRG